MENSNIASCQTCMGQLELPINLFESSYSELLDVLQRLLAFQVYTEGSEFFVCQQCQRKLRWITEFQNICLKSLEPLRNDVKYIKTEQSSFLAGHNSDDNLPIPSLVWNAGFTGLKSPRFDDDCDSTKHESTVPKQETGKLKIRKQRRVKRSAARGSKIRADSLEKQIRSADKAEVELNLQDVDEDDDRSCSLFGDGSDSDNDYHQTKGSNKKRKRLNKEKTRPQDCTKKSKLRNLAAAVLQAIKELDSRQTDLKNRQCVFCDYISRTFAMLKSHVIKKHKDVIKEWCENCNIRIKDLEEHRDDVGCHLWLCRFCEREQQTAKRLREHLKICPKGRNAIVTDLPVVSDDSDVTIVADVSKRKPVKSTNCKRRKIHRVKRLPRSVVLQAIKEVNSYRFDMKNRQCLFCTFVGEKAVALQTHMTHKHKDVAMENNWCRHCNVLVDDVQTHRDSVRCHIWQCKLCKDWGGARRASTLFSHLRVHGGIRPSLQGRIESQPNVHLCSLCGKTFKTSYKLKEHACAAAERLFKCPVCDRCYTSEKSLRTHREEHGSFICQICGKRSTSKSCHRVHMKIHEDGGPAQCTICDKVFVRPGRLKLHMKEHTGNHQCMVCSKSFRAKCLLINHMRVHNEERPFKCSYCGRGFNAKATCLRHELTHTGEKPFKCLICPYSAPTLFGLSIHMKQHPEDAPQPSKPHKCPLCHRSFTTNTVLVAHTSLVHGKK